MDKTTNLRYSLGTSELRGKTLEEKIVYAKVHLNLSQRKIASTLRCHPSKVQRTVEAHEDSRDLGVNGRPNHLNKKELDEFVTLVKCAIDQGAVVDYNEASRMAREIYIVSRQSCLKENIPNFDSKWVKRVFDQHGIKIIDPREVEEERFFTKEQVEMFLEDYRSVLFRDNIEREFIWNLDETQLGGDRSKRKVATKAGGPVLCIPSAKTEEHITLELFVNAAGEHANTTAIVPLKCKPYLSQEVQDNMNIAGTEEGWITTAVFKNLVEVGFRKVIQKKRKELNKPNAKAVLLLDGHISREGLDLMLLNRVYGIKVMWIPPHSSALLQPLDLGPNGELKKVYGRIHKQSGSGDPEQRRDASLKDAKRALSVALSEHIIKVGWERTGLFPLDPGTTLSSNMVKKNEEQLPSRAKRSRGQRFCESGVHYVSEGMVFYHEEEAQAKKNKKLKTNKNNSTNS